MRTLRLLIVALTVTLLAGCGGKGGGTTGGSPLSSTETISQSGSTQVRASVKVMPTNGTVTVTRLTDSSASFTGTFALSPGDVLVSNKGDLQFARKVVSVSRSGDITTVETAPITLSDVFSSADLERVETVAPAAFADVPALLPGETIGPATKRPGKLAYTIPITFQNTYVTGLNGEPGIVIDGRVDIDVTFDTVLKTNWFGAVSELKIVPTVKAVGQVTATAQAGMAFKRTVPITPTVKIPLTPLGPLALTVDLQLNLDVTAKLAGKLTQQAGGSVSAAAGPWYKNSKWTLARAFDYEFNIPPPVVEAEASIWISAGQPRFAVTLLGIASAWIKADVAKAGAEVKVVALPTPGVSGQAKLVFGGAAGVTLLFFGSQELGSPPALRHGRARTHHGAAAPRGRGAAARGRGAAQRRCRHRAHRRHLDPEEQQRRQRGLRTAQRGAGGHARLRHHHRNPGRPERHLRPHGDVAIGERNRHHRQPQPAGERRARPACSGTVHRRLDQGRDR
ncbi:MAG: hypothetical protein EB084_22745, partial [Proteobacteria bacterium]|nr:hypothetical protein [Pseudomonadota bacterium]